MKTEYVALKLKDTASFAVSSWLFGEVVSLDKNGTYRLKNTAIGFETIQPNDKGDLSLSRQVVAEQLHAENVIKVRRNSIQYERALTEGEVVFKDYEKALDLYKNPPKPKLLNREERRKISTSGKELAGR